MNEYSLYKFNLKKEFSIPNLDLEFIKYLTNEAFNKYKKHKHLKEINGENPRSFNLLKASYASGLRRTIVSQYRCYVIESILDNLIEGQKIPIQALNDFSTKLFNSTMSNNDIHHITTSKEYSHLFIKRFNRGKKYKALFELDENQESKIISNNALYIEKAISLFNSLD